MKSFGTLLICPSFDLQRRDLLAGIVQLLQPFVQVAILSNDALTQLLLYGDQDLSNDFNKKCFYVTFTCFLDHILLGSYLSNV